jgi:peptidoglycan/LPS O-acetylase OafA/YrhL
VILDISGKSLGEYLAFFLIGYYVLSNDNILEKFNKYRFTVYFLFFICMVLIFISFNKIIYFNDIIYDTIAELYAYMGIITFLLVAERYMNKSNKLFTYLSKSSFCVYLFHQMWIVVTAYYIFKIIGNSILQIVIILTISIVFTYGTYEIVKRIKPLMFIFGIKAYKNSQTSA